MKYRFFTVPALSSDIAQEEINNFCAGNKVATVEKQFVADGDRSFWSICVTYLDDNHKQTNLSKGRIDYREVLNEKDFAVFAKLRTLRKNMAENEGVPAYALFTNEQLATMVRGRIIAASDLNSIDGVGKAKLDKYGKAFLAILRKEFDTTGSDEGVF